MSKEYTDGEEVRCSASGPISDLPSKISQQWDLGDRLSLCLDKSNYKELHIYLWFIAQEVIE